MHLVDLCSQSMDFQTMMNSLAKTAPNNRVVHRTVSTLRFMVVYANSSSDMRARSTRTSIVLRGTVASIKTLFIQLIIL
jgi:hypothetical protein